MSKKPKEESIEDLEAELAKINSLTEATKKILESPDELAKVTQEKKKKKEKKKSDKEKADSYLVGVKCAGPFKGLSCPHDATSRVKERHIWRCNDCWRAQGKPLIIWDANGPTPVYQERMRLLKENAKELIEGTPSPSIVTNMN